MQTERLIDRDFVSVKAYLDKFCGMYGESPFMRLNNGGNIELKMYSQLKEDSFALANAFIERGWTGKHLALLSENRYEFVVVFFASLLSGTVFMPVNIALEPAKVASMISFADIDIVCVTNKTAPLAALVKQACPGVTEYMSIDAADGFVDYASLIGSGRAMPQKDYKGSFQSDDTVLLCFTSGTSSGKPKCVELRAASIFTPATHRMSRFAQSPDGRVIGQQMYMPLPLFHLAALVSATIGACIPNGDALTVSTSMADCFRDIKATQPHFIFAVPALAEAMCSMMEGAAQKLGLSFGDIDPSDNGALTARRWATREALAAVSPNLRMFILCGAKVPEELERRIYSFGISAGNCYGLTECSPQITVDGTPLKKRSGTVGIPCSFNEVRIVDNVLYVRGENVMKGYYKNPDATAEVLTPDGWLCTGDIAEIDEEGYVSIKGRATAVVVLSNGDNIDSEEIEQLFVSAPEIAEIVVIGDKKNNNDTLGALIYPKEGVTPEDIRRVVNEINKTLPIQQRIVRYRITDKPFEKNEMMKIKRYMYVEEEI